jgi:hypothetical protein
MVASAAILLSQALIIHAWKDAWAGTIPNVILLMIVVVSAGTVHFSRMAREEGVGLFEAARQQPVLTATEERLATLPPVVRTWLIESGALARGPIRTVRLKQRGTMRTEPAGPWMPVHADQVFTLNPPGFVWSARIEAFPLIDLVGRDMYAGGKGNMLIKVLSLIPIADSWGEEIDQGTMVRWLAEIAWFPTAALSPLIRWEEAGLRAARATMSYNGTTASGVFSFNEKGELTGFEALRYGEFDGKYRLEPWSIAMSGNKARDGVVIPCSSTVTWRLSEGDFTWFTLEITDVQYNPPGPS